MSQVEFEKIKIPKTRNLQFKFELQGEFNITSFVARQKVNRCLLMNAGNLIHSMEPDLVISDHLCWKVPIGYSTPERGFMGELGYVFVEAINGNLQLENSTPIHEMEANAERLYQKAVFKKKKDFSCVPACHKMILEFFNKPVAESNLRKQLKTKPFGTHIINVFSLKEIHGIQAKIEFWSLEELKIYLHNTRTPCIALVWTEYLAHWKQSCLHSIIVIGYDDEHVIINDPNFDENEFLIPFDDFVNAWQINDGLVVIFKKYQM